MRQRLRLLLLAAAIGLSAGVLACTGDKPDATTPSPDAGCPFLASPPTRTPVPTPTRVPTPVPLTLADLPTPEWQPVDPSSLRGLELIGQPFFLDVETEQLYSLAPASLFSLQGDRIRLAIIAWSPSGDMLVTASRQRRNDKVAATFLGRPDQPFSLVDVGAPMSGSYSPDGSLLALIHENRVEILEAAALTEVDSLDGAAIAPMAWSPDSAYLAVDLAGAPGESHRTLLWRRTDRTRSLLPGSAVAWSTTGTWLTYSTGANHPSGHAGWVYDPNSGATLKYVANESAGFWSPGDRYMATWRSEGQYASFTIYSLSDGKRLVTVTGAWFKGWLDDSRLFFIGNICSTFDLFSMQADGSELTKLPIDSEYALDVYQSPEGRYLAYGVYKGEPLIRLYDTKTGSVRDVPNQARLSLFGLDRRKDIWSPDGRYLRLEGAFGRDGPCYPIPTPQTTTVEKS